MKIIRDENFLPRYISGIFSQGLKAGSRHFVTIVRYGSDKLWDVLAPFTSTGSNGM